MPVVERALGQNSMRMRGIYSRHLHSMPVLAVRRPSPDLIGQALMALAASERTEDVRDLMFYLARLHHSATKLGLDTRKLFDDVAGLVASGHLQEATRSFPLRAPGNRDLAAFFFRETLTNGEFDIVQDSAEGR